MPPPQQSNTPANPPAGQAPKYAPPPSNLPLYQRVDPKTTTFFAKTHVETVQEQKSLIFGIKRVDRLRHMYAIGRAGSGKSKVLEMIVRQDIAYGYGVLVLDPIGDLVRDVLSFIPKTRINDVIVIDVTDEDYAFVWNPLRDVPESLRHRYTQALLEVFEMQFGAGWSPRVEYILRFSFLALLDYPHATLESVAQLLTDSAFRTEVSGYIRDAGVRQFWSHEFALWEERFTSEAIFPVVNKIRAILSDPTLGAMFGSGENTFRFAEVLSGERIVLVNLARAQLGVSDAKFLASLLLATLSVAAIDEGAQGRRTRPFYLFADGVLNAVPLVAEAMLSDAKRTLIGAYLSHQHAGELSAGLKRFILGNTGTILAFRVTPEDATWIEPEFAPTLKAKDFAALPPRVCAIKLTIDGSTQDPFLAETLTVHAATGSSSQEIREAARKAYAKPRKDILALAQQRQQEMMAIRKAVQTMEGDLQIPIAPPMPVVREESNKDAPVQQEPFVVPDTAGEATKDLREEGFTNE